MLAKESSNKTSERMFDLLYRVSEALSTCVALEYNIDVERWCWWLKLDTSENQVLWQLSAEIIIDKCSYQSNIDNVTKFFYLNKR